MTEEAQLVEIKSKFEGNWKLDRSENFDEFLKEVGVNFMLRKMASLSKPTNGIKVEGDKITITLNAGFMNKSDTFKLGEEFETDFQGDRMRLTITFEDGKLVTTSKPVDENLKPQRTTREIIGEELYMEMYVSDVVCKRYFKRV